MGCDIHLFLEKRNQSGKWDIVPPPQTKLSYRWSGDQPRSEARGPAFIDWGGDEITLAGWFTSRSYALFSILADVRNYTDIRYLSLPRGVPSDSSPEYAEEVERFGRDGHSYTYFTLVELEHMLQKVKKIPTKGVVAARHFMDCGGDPQKFDSWCADVSGPGVQIFAQQVFQAQPVEEQMNLAASGQSYIRCQWDRSSDDVMGEFNKMVQEVKDTNPGVSPADLRFVFFFDN